MPVPTPALLFALVIFLAGTVKGGLDLFRKPEPDAPKPSAIKTAGRWNMWLLCLVNLIAAIGVLAGFVDALGPLRFLPLFGCLFTVDQVFFSIMNVLDAGTKPMMKVISILVLVAGGIMVPVALQLAFSTGGSA